MATHFCRIRPNFVSPHYAFLNWNSLYLYMSFYSIQQVAQILSASEAFIRQQIKSGKLRAERLQIGYRISQKDLDAYLVAIGLNSKINEVQAQ